MLAPRSLRWSAAGPLLVCVFAATPAHGEVTALGDYTTNIAIEVPSLRGRAPTVNLSYASTGGNGHVGVGWRLDATSAIMRTGARGGVPTAGPAAGDHFVLDGQELMACQVGSTSPSCTTAEHTLGSSSGYYSTRREAFTRLHHAGGTSTWTMWLTDGRTGRYETFDAGQSWLLTHTEDRHGNALDYAYACDPGLECQLESIKWGVATFQPSAEVHFYYEARPDITRRATGTGFVVLSRRLRSITVHAAGSLVRAYALGYQTASTSGRSILTTVQQFGRDAYVNTKTDPGRITTGATPPLPATTLATAGGGTGWRFGAPATKGAFAVGDLGGVGPVPRHYVGTTMPALNVVDDPETDKPLPDQTLVGDFDGDGRADVANAYVSTYCKELGIQGRLTRKGGSIEIKGERVTTNLQQLTDCTPRYWIADIDGDHRDDLLYKFANRLHVARLVGDRFRPLVSSGVAWSYYTNQCAIGDVDGDQRDDLVCLDGNKVITSRSQGDGSFTRSTFDPQTVPSMTSTTRMAIGDVNADGFADVVLAVVDGSTYQLYPLLATGLGFTAAPSIATGWPVGSDDALSTADLDGDGLADLLLTRGPTGGAGGYAIASGGGNGGRFRFGALAVTGSPALGDVDGDGRTDLVSSSDFTAQLGDGQGGFSAPVTVFPTTKCGNPWIVDTDGDGRTDLLCVGSTTTLGARTINLDDYSSQYPLRDPHRWMSADLDGDGQGDYVYVYAKNPGVGVLSVLTSGTPRRVPWQVTPTPIMPGLDDSSAVHWMAADVGSPGGGADGKADLVMVDTDGSTLRVYTLLSKGDGTYSERYAFPWTDTLGNTLPYAAADLGNFWPIDANADGETDLVHLVATSSGISTELLLASGDGAWRRQPVPYYSFGTSVGVVGASDFRPMDINGDGLTDLVHTQTTAGVAGTQIRTLLNRGDGTFTPIYSIMATTYVDVARWLVLDANGDGMTDLVHVESTTSPTGSGIALQTVLSRGDGTFELVSVGTAWLAASSPDLARGLEATNSMFAADLDGNGVSDLMHVSRYRDAGGVDRTLLVQLRNPAATGTTWAAYAFTPGAAAPAAPPWAWRPIRDSARPQSTGFAWIDGNAGASVFYDIPTDRLARIANGNGGITEVTYAPLLGHREYLPAGSLPVVTTKVTRSDVTYTSPIIEETTYAYDGARWSDALQRMAGYRYVGSRDPDLYSMTEYTLDDACPGMVAGVSTENATTGAAYGFTKNGFAAPGAGPFTCLAQQQSKYSCGGHGMCRLDSDVTLTYDAYGNVVSTVEQIAEGATRVTYAPVDANEADYVTTFPMYRAEYQRDGNGMTLLSQDLFEYDGNTSYNAKPQATAEARRVHHWDSVNARYLTSSLEYNAHGMLVASTSPTGARTTTTYDATYGAFPLTTCDPVGCVTQYWDLALGKEVVRYDYNNTPTETHYDAHGRAIEVRNGSGGVTHTLILDLGTFTGTKRQRIRQEVKDDSSDGVRWTERYLDGWGRTYRAEAEGSGAQTTELDGLTGRPRRISETFQLGSSPQYFTSYSYDGLGRTTKETAPDGTKRTWTYRLGEADAINELGDTRTLAYDGLGRVIRVTETVGGTSHVTTYGYDAKRRLVGIVDPAGLVTSYYYDTLGQLIAEADPDRGLRQYTYRADGALETSLDAKRQTIRYDYDPSGRPAQRLDVDASGSTTRTVRWTYDALPSVVTGSSIGRIVAIDDDQGNTLLASRFVYDPLGRVSEQTNCIDKDCKGLRRTFTVAGQLETLTYPDPSGTFGAGAETVDHTYDDAGRLIKVGDYVTDVRYTVDSRVDTLRYGNDIVAHYSYDPARRWTDSLSIGDTSTLYSARYTHDAAGQLTTVEEAAPTNTDTFDYHYDELGRLISVGATDPALARQYQYDELGRMTYNSQLGDYHYDDPAHPHAMTRADHGAYRDYDENGNVAKLSDPSGRAFKIGWTVDDRPAEIDGSAGTVTMAYDSSGRRVKKAGSSSASYFNDNVAIENGQLIKYYYAGSQLIARDDGTRVYYHQDHTRSTRLETDTRGRVVNSYQYDVFGAPVREHESFDDNIGFSGVHGDQELGLTYLNARYYDPTTGRFLSSDSVVRDAYSPQSLDRYAYVENDPVNYYDPSGHMRRDIELMMERKQMWRSLMVAFEAGQNECAISEFCTAGTKLVVVWARDGSIKAVVQPGNDPAVAQWHYERQVAEYAAARAGGGGGEGGGGGGGKVTSVLPNAAPAGGRNAGRHDAKPVTSSVPLPMDANINATNSTQLTFAGDLLKGVKVSVKVTVDELGNITATVDPIGKDVKAIVRAEGDLITVTVTQEQGAKENVATAGGGAKSSDGSQNKIDGNASGTGHSNVGVPGYVDDGATVNIGVSGGHTGTTSSEGNSSYQFESRTRISNLVSDVAVLQIIVHGDPAPRPSPPHDGGILESIDDGVTHYTNVPGK